MQKNKSYLERSRYVTLITGGIKSGKSSYALRMAHEFGTNRALIATAEPFDDDMKMRIARHREERGADFQTIEEPIDLAGALKKTEGQFDCIVIDCLTLWLNNLYFHLQGPDAELTRPRRTASAIDAFTHALENSRSRVILVTNEIGLGVTPIDRQSRYYVDDLGRLNQQTAEAADEVIFMIAGIPQRIKGASYVPLP